MKSASEDIATLLDAEASLSLTLALDLFFSRMPDAPDDCVAVIDNPGSPPLLTFSKSTSNYFYSSVSVWVRNIDYALGWAQIDSIMTYLHGLSNQVVGSTYYALIKATGDPQHAQWDESDRGVFIINFEVQRKPN